MMSGIEDKSPFEILNYVILAVIVIAVLLFLSPIFIVGAGERGVIFNSFSGVNDRVYDEGIHFKIPLIESPTIFEVRNKRFDADASASSQDLQIVHTKIAVNYHLETNTVQLLFKEIGANYEERIIYPSVQEIVKSITAKHPAEQLITQREIVKDEIKTRLTERLKPSHIVLDDISITNFDFSEEFNKAIELKVMAEQNALKEQNNLKMVEFQAQQKVAQAKGEAEAVRIINEQLLKSPSYIQYMAVQKWNGIMPLATGVAMPFIDIVGSK